MTDDLTRDEVMKVRKTHYTDCRCDYCDILARHYNNKEKGE